MAFLKGRQSHNCNIMYLRGISDYYLFAGPFTLRSIYFVVHYAYVYRI
jgi:hypothetical protein